MSTGTRIGPAQNDWAAGLCAYAPDENSLGCYADATWHGIEDHPPTAETVRGLSSCDEHKHVMQRLMRYVHAYDTACGLPASRFIQEENRCVLLV